MSSAKVQGEDEGYFESPFEDDGTARPQRLPPLKLARVQMSPHENAPGDRFQIRLTLSCDGDEIAGADARYGVRLRQCHVHLDTQHCRVDDATAYTYDLPKEDWSQATKDAASVQTGTAAGFGAEIAAVPRAHGLRARISAGLTRKKAREEKAEQATKSARLFDLIGYGPSGWYVGHAVHGDPRRDGYLRSTYFNEQKDRFLCAVDIARNAPQATVVARVHARIGQLSIGLLDERGPWTGEAGQAHAEDFDRAMRDRLRGLVLGRALHRQQLTVIPDLPENACFLAEDVLHAHKPAAKQTRSVPRDAPARPARPRKPKPA